MRYLALIAVGLASCTGVADAQAGDAPAIIIPGKAGVPVMIYGADASYCVVEGDYGLDRPGHVPLLVYACPIVPPPISGSGRSYYPAAGRQPGYGRFEIEPPPNRRLPPPAQDYRREWGTQSDAGPAVINPPAGNNYILGDEESLQNSEEARERWRERRERRAERLRERRHIDHRRPQPHRRHH